MDRGAWLPTFHGVAKSWIRLSASLSGKGHCVLRSIFPPFTEMARGEQISFLPSSVFSFSPGNWLVLP